jgi:hypothetical protein
MAELSPIHDYILTDHVRQEMARRQITESDVATVLLKPGQVETVRPGRAVYQSKLTLGNPERLYLLRVFVDIDREPPEVVTAYRTRKVEKYWRAEV